MSPYTYSPIPSADAHIVLTKQRCYTPKQEGLDDFTFFGYNSPRFLCDECPICTQELLLHRQALTSLN